MKIRHGYKITTRTQDVEVDFGVIFTDRKRAQSILQGGAKKFAASYEKKGIHVTFMNDEDGNKTSLSFTENGKEYTMTYEISHIFIADDEDNESDNEKE